MDQVDKEVGWIGTVERVGRDYLIKEVFLLDQEAASTTCEITPDGLAEWAGQVLSERTDGMDVVNSVRFWGHSHVNMGTSPSHQDESQMKVFAEACDDFFIRGILNKAGRMEFTLYIFSIGIEIEDVDWQLYEPTSNTRRAKWQAEIRTKVREKVYVPAHTYQGGVVHNPFGKGQSRTGPTAIGKSKSGEDQRRRKKKEVRNGD